MGLETILAIVSIGVAAAGAGMSYSAQTSAARTQSTFALLNAQAQSQAARQQGRQQMLSAEIQAAAARAQQASQANNAAAMVEQVEANSRIASENIRRSREEFARTLGAMRAGASESGVLETTGSPLDFLVKASEDQQLYEAEQRWADEGARRQGFRAAAIERSGAAQSGLNAALYTIDGAAALAAGRLGASQARLNGYAGLAAADGMRTQAAAGLVSNIGSTSLSAYQMYQNRTPRSSGTYG